MAENFNRKDIQGLKKPLSPFFVFCSKIRKEFKEKKMDTPNLKQLSEMWKKVPDNEKEPFYIKYDEEKNQYEKSTNGKTQDNLYHKVNVKKRTCNEMINNSINSSSNDDLFIKNKLFKSSIKFEGPIKQDIIIHHSENVRKSMGNNYHVRTNIDINSHEKEKKQINELNFDNKSNLINDKSLSNEKKNNEKNKNNIAENPFLSVQKNKDILSNNNLLKSNNNNNNISINPFITNNDNIINPFLSSEDNHLSSIPSNNNIEINNPFLQKNICNNNIFTSNINDSNNTNINSFNPFRINSKDKNDNNIFNPVKNIVNNNTNNSNNPFLNYNNNTCKNSDENSSYFTKLNNLKRPLPPFFVFCSKIRKEFEEKKMDKPNPKQLSEMWKNLPDNEKEPFYIKYDEEKNRYEKAIKKEIEGN